MKVEQLRELLQPASVAARVEEAGSPQAAQRLAWAAASKEDSVPLGPGMTSRGRSKTASLKAQLRAQQKAFKAERAAKAEWDAAPGGGAAAERDPERLEVGRAGSPTKGSGYDERRRMEASMGEARRCAPEAADARETVTLFVKMPDGSTCVLRDLPTSYGADEIRHALRALASRDEACGERRRGFGAHEVTLVHGSRDFRRGESVAYRGIKDGATLHLLVRALGGAELDGFDDTSMI